MFLKAVRAARRAEGTPRPDDFSIITAPLPDPGPGEVVVANEYLSVDPYMREFMALGGWELGYGLEGRAIGRVIASTVADLPEGAFVAHRHGWSTHARLTPAELRVITEYEGVPASAHLGLLGGTGLTAWVGLTRVARVRPGDDVFVSTAAGAVGGAAGQFARLLGARRVVGSTGSPAKVGHVVGTLGFAAAFDYHDGLAEGLARVAPDGVDVYFDNVGGAHLEAAIDVLREFGRVAWCGAIAQYATLADPPPAPRNLYDVVGKSLRLEGFLVRRNLDARPELEDFAVPRIRSGDLVVDETVVDGFDRLPEAFLGLLRGENTGKMLVRL
ncbi:NADP-dependent oxidoreductase [Actinosynnema sp. NPDC020468]|uniref:NADP-dependent oxidoreductase n=1 Tax=Actinosynnema sp. NPDC020468 TaxID=3154488 RepID=UPI0033C44B87